MLNDHFVTIDRQCQLVEGVGAWCTLSGQTAEGAAARQWLQAIDEPDRHAIARLLVSNADQRTPFGAEARLRRADGEVRWVAMRFVPSRSSSDGAWLGIVTDIDAEKHRDESAALSAHFSELFAPDADERTILRTLAGIAVPAFADCCTVHLLRDDGTIENVAVVGAEESQVDATRRLERFSRIAPDAPLHSALRTACVQLHARVTEEFLLEHLAADPADGEFLRSLGVRSLIVAPIVIRDRAAGAIRFIRSTSERRYCQRDAALAEDVARRAALAIENARSRSEALASGHSRDIFLATLSHEMRTPLTSILGWTQVLRAAGPGSELFGEALHAIEQSANVQQRLIDDLLDVSRIITGKLHLDFAPIAVRELLDSAIGTLAPRAREAGQHIRLTSPDDLTVYGDETRLRQVLWNLLTNAMKFTPPGGLIEVITTADEENVAISVRDTGRGIRAEVLPHVFDRFHQASVADRAKHRGLGLGLAIVRNIVERHGGSVEAQSPGEGKGATFSVRLPVYRNQVDAKEQSNDTSADSDYT
jgi:PAS domain S-box-containing protein